MSVLEYFAFLFLLCSQFIIKNNSTEDWEMPHFDLKQALNDLKPKFTQGLLEDLIINRINYNKIDKSFYNITDITKRPLVELQDNKVVPLSLRRLFIGLTDSVYFDILDYISDEKQKKEFPTYFGKAIEDYFADIIINIDKNCILPFKYGRKNNDETSDAILIQDDGIIFFECKKRQFHTLEFLQYGNKEFFHERLKEFCFKPLEQICNRIKDFREGKYSLNGTNRDDTIYPVVVSPLVPPFLSGGWDMFDLDNYVLPNYFKEDKNIEPPEFIEFAELECIEEYLRQNPDSSFIDLIKMKRADKVYHNSNWMVILQKNNINYKNKRLANEYHNEMRNFKNLLFC